MKVPSGIENRIFCPRRVLFLNQESIRRELQDIVPGIPKPGTFSKSKKYYFELCSYFAALVLSCFWLTKIHVKFSEPKTIVASGIILSDGIILY